eukprot:gnl/MRDRNA2_/MRDRNA2_154647_c0_seq1.p1 gnl/MRDRNA2_/MRDRNA2_154647_c0~~gnl/MRDRNA2_/MRDRNA2_154647_c0_seq1.p1  ORF type:complete len:498 (+),score=123.36 gnl/MRDRNA2_/MRDRNA2_154647_c0_seq1:207-1496(+)
MSADVHMEALAERSRQLAASVQGLIENALRQMTPVNDALKKVYLDRDNLNDIRRYGSDFEPSEDHEPLNKVVILDRPELNHGVSQLEFDSETAARSIFKAREAARAALLQAESARASYKGSKPPLMLDEVKPRPPPPGAGGGGHGEEGNANDNGNSGGGKETKAEPEKTASGCKCDEQFSCGPNNRPFGWCMVGKDDDCELNKKENDGVTPPETPPKKGEPGPPIDPTGQDHVLHTHFVDKENARKWDYCISNEAQAEEDRVHPDALKTAHLNCRCQDRPDILVKYEYDPKFADADGNFDVTLVPLRDRPAVEREIAARKSPDHALCGPTASSGGFAVCPVAQDCAADGVYPPPSSWFTGLSARSWDFCQMPEDGGGKGATATESNIGFLVSAVVFAMPMLPAIPRVDRKHAASFFPSVPAASALHCVQ